MAMYSNLTTTSPKMSTSKGKQKAITNADESDESDLELYPQSYLNELLEKAKAACKEPIERAEQEESFISLEKDESEYDRHRLDGKLNLHNPRFASQGTSASARCPETLASAIPCKRRG